MESLARYRARRPGQPPRNADALLPEDSACFSGADTTLADEDSKFSWGGTSSVTLSACFYEGNNNLSPGRSPVQGKDDVGGRDGSYQEFTLQQTVLSPSIGPVHPRMNNARFSPHGTDQLPEETFDQISKTQTKMPGLLVSIGNKPCCQPTRRKSDAFCDATLSIASSTENPSQQGEERSSPGPSSWLLEEGSSNSAMPWIDAPPMERASRIQSVSTTTSSEAAPSMPRRQASVTWSVHTEDASDPTRPV
jgi:hypothetical protein